MVMKIWFRRSFHYKAIFLFPVKSIRQIQQEQSERMILDKMNVLIFTCDYSISSISQKNLIFPQMSEIHETSCLTATSKSQLNKSTAKACYTFSKKPREPLHSKPNDLMYELPSMMSKRSTSIGFGKKSTIQGPNFSPSPDRYEKPSDFDKSPKKGQTFGLSREEIKAVSIFNHNKYPGPCDYEGKISEIKESPKNYSIRTRNGFPQIFQSTHNPGPGHYQIKQDTEKSFFYDSRRKSPQIYTIKKSNKENNKISPVGPTSYDTSLPSMGPQVLAKRKTQQSFFFPKQIRETMRVTMSNVGPGSYHQFSEFGK